MAVEKQTFGEEDTINEAKDTLERVNSWITQCDQKSGIMLGIIGVAFSIMISLDFIKTYKDVIISGWEYWYGKVLIIAIVLAFFAVVIGTLFLIRTLIPITDNKLFKELYINTRSKIYFDSISKYDSFKEYKDKFTHFRKQDYINDLLSQVYINSQIASKKYKAYKMGMIISLIGFTAFAVLTILIFVLFK